MNNVFLLALLWSAHGFISPKPSNNFKLQSTMPVMFAVDEASAQALSDYMAKSHEEKLKAVKQVEDKKNAEISALKEQIQQLKSSAVGTTTPAPTKPAEPLERPVAEQLAPLSDKSLEAKLASYQNFMAEYIVNAQNQKLLAMREAELKAEKKFQERLEKLLSAGGLPPPDNDSAAVAVEHKSAAPVAKAEASPETESAAPVAEESLYDKRNKMVAASAAAGKSRWGIMEVEKAQTSVKLAEHLGATEKPVPPPAAAEESLFEQRNARVIAAASAGKSRWGDAEVNRLHNGVSDPAVKEKKPNMAEVSLEDRVNLGARLLKDDEN